ncbi:Arginine transport ATP-binding protein ArtM [Chromobacterium violaceum]|uniref:Arginine transport ATP-binding protein ArtM n=1 Tax=Chromobacterium violaceum TaxID=536 RepID=A0A447TG14_CHRVL|nr:Arginine transport ATP-binding protein ArtM [Chromobacterium violaceum]
MIKLSHIVKSFGGQEVLHDVSLALAEGGVTALIGPSGSGKSTLLRCANLLETPDGGELQLAGETLRFEPAGSCPATPSCACAASPAWCSKASSCFRTRPCCRT